ncbi:MAG TPA: hypothetical protein VE954_39585 [Oligoflexus sp.]|uniref:hypothetical protein n=1 Tax=Oligoflexus sp. TaxID=1971216 RepID=UPI002D4CE524|nr:hypothetical protein [Oligoflexus sp.]HYX39243.1 hypothetical protein [Oligoflexus sp.]
MREKRLLVVIVAIFLASNGTVITKKIWDDRTRNVGEAKQTEAKGNEASAIGSPDSRGEAIADSGKDEASAFKADSVPIESIPKGTRAKTKGDKTTPCTPAYEDMMEVPNNPSVLETLASKITENCTIELSKNVRTWDKAMKSMMESCMGDKEKYTDRDMASLQSMLIGRLMKSNPEKYENEFYSTLSDIERRSPEASLIARILRYNSKIEDPDFQAELVEFIQRYPQEPYGHHIKAALQASKEDWAGADALMVKVMSLPLSERDKKFYQAEREKFAAKQKGYTKRFSVSLGA